jgi:predicted transcriptional regulator
MSDDVINAIEMTADIVSAYVGNNSVSASDLPRVIQQVHSAIKGISEPPVEAPAVAQRPAVPIKRSVQPDHVVCLEDGRKFKSLKRHLQARYNLSPEEYRAKWGLPTDYPMVAPNYAATRSALAKSMGLGLGRRQPKASAPEPKAAAPAKKSREKALADV